MKLMQRVLAITLCTGMVCSVVMTNFDRSDRYTIVTIAGTMSGNNVITKTAASSTNVTDPYYGKQWYLYNDGTFTASQQDTVDVPGEISRQPNDGTTTVPGTNEHNNHGMPSSGNMGGFPGGFRRMSSSDFSTDLLSELGSRPSFAQRIKAVTDVDIDAEQAWDVVGDQGRDVIIAVIDTGVDYTQEELTNAIWTNPGEVAGDGIDNDGNGYIDDVYGWDFYNDKSFSIESSSTEYDHGTHIAGVIAAAADDTGIAGIFPNNNVKIMSLKVLGGSEGSGEAADVIKAIKYADEMGASICNLSFGTQVNDTSLKAAIEASDMLFVCAAGNASRSIQGENNDLTPTYPASYDLTNIISVANLTYDGTLDITSNYGASSVDIAAPGTYILSTVSGDKYEYMTGTSMAAPVVTAVAALVYSYRDGLSLSQVKDVVLNSAESSTALSGKVATG